MDTQAMAAQARDVRAEVVDEIVAMIERYELDRLREAVEEERNDDPMNVSLTQAIVARHLGEAIRERFPDG